MLRITDARTGEPIDAVPARRSLTRVEAHVERDDLSALRVLLVADVLARTLELGGTPVRSEERRGGDRGAGYTVYRGGRAYIHTAGG
ncbi:hypothetical protein ABT086_43435, partial [Streptomyces mirabilis]